MLALLHCDFTSRLTNIYHIFFIIFWFVFVWQYTLFQYTVLFDFLILLLLIPHSQNQYIFSYMYPLI